MRPGWYWATVAWKSGTGTITNLEAFMFEVGNEVRIKQGRGTLTGTVVGVDGNTVLVRIGVSERLVKRDVGKVERIGEVAEAAA